MLDRLKLEVDMAVGDLAGSITDRLYLGDLLEEDPIHPVYFSALRHLLRLPTWRLWIASKALGTRPIDDRLAGD